VFLKSRVKRGSNTTSFNEWINSCSDTSQKRLSDSDQSSYYTSSDSGGKCSEKYAESESEWTSSVRFCREGYFIDHMSRDEEPQAPSKEKMKTEKNESKSNSVLKKNVINKSISKEAQRNSNLNQDKPSVSLCQKRNLSSSPSCAEKAPYAEKASEIKSAQKSPRRKGKTKKKKKGSIVKRLFQRMKS